MRRIITAIMGTISGLVLLFSYHTSTNAQATGEVSDQSSDTTQESAASTPNAGSAATDSQGSQDTASSAATSAAAQPSASSSASTKAVSGTFTGNAIQTEWGIVQVRIKVKDGKITTAEAIKYPNESGQDRQINGFAVPKLNAAVVAAQSADIDSISGATVTSGGYRKSLQSAIDEAKL